MRSVSSRCWYSITAIVAALISPATLSAQTGLSSAVRNLRDALHAPIAADVPESTALETRRQAISDSAVRLCRLVDLRDALLLDTWRDNDADLSVAAIDGPLRTGIQARFQAMIRASLQAGDDSTRLAALSVIEETAGLLQQQPYTSWNLGSLTPDVAYLACAPGSKAVRLQATAALGQLESDTRTVARACTVMLQSPDVQLRREAAKAVSTLSSSLLKLVQSRGAAHAWTVPALARALEDILQVAALGLRDEDLIVRQASAVALDQFAQSAGQLVLDPRIRGAEQPAPDVNTLFHALHEETTGLAAALNDSDPDVRIRCRQALLAMAGAGQEWQQSVARLGSKESGMSARYGTLSSACSQTDTSLGLRMSVPALARGLADPNVRARRAAALALEGLGEEAASAEPALVQALGDDDLFVRWAAMRALCRLPQIDTMRAVPAIARLVQDPDLDVRIAAAKALKALKCPNPEAIEALTRAVNDREPALQVAAIQALAVIGPPARSAIPAIAESMAASEARVRTAAAAGLSAFGSESAPYVEVLGNGAADTDHKVRQAASDAMLTIAAAPSRSTASLVTTLELVNHDHPIASPPAPATPLVTTLELVNHDHPSTPASAPPAPPAALPTSATEASVPIGPLASAATEPFSGQSIPGPDLGASTGTQQPSAAARAREASKAVAQTGPDILLPGPLPPTVNNPADTRPVINQANSVPQPAPVPAATALTMSDISPAIVRKGASPTPPVFAQPLNVAGWRPSLPDRPIEQKPTDPVKRDTASVAAKPIEAAFSAGGDYTTYQPPIHLPAGVIAISPGGAVVPRAPDSASSACSTTWQSYKPASNDSVIAVSRPLPSGPPLISPPAYSLDPSRVIASSSPYAR
jgi:HEAT repeat protein